MRPARAPARLTDPRGGYGRAGELIAIACYRLCGYRILGRRVRTAAGEVDIVARRGATLVVIEVKRRRRVDPAAVWLGRWQLCRIHRAARLLAGEAPWARRVRVDLVTIVGARVRITRDI